MEHERALDANNVRHFRSKKRFVKTHSYEIAQQGMARCCIALLRGDSSAAACIESWPLPAMLLLFKNPKSIFSKSLST